MFIGVLAVTSSKTFSASKNPGVSVFPVLNKAGRTKTGGAGMSRSRV
jgi:hypothetical protein